MYCDRGDSISPLSSLPTDLITLTANLFLHDRSTFALGMSAKRFFTDLHSSYLIKTQLRCIFGVAATMEAQLQQMKPQERMLVVDTMTESSENASTAISSSLSTSVLEESSVQPRKKQKREVCPSKAQSTVQQLHLQPTIRLKWYCREGEKPVTTTACYAIGIRSNFYIQNFPLWRKPGIDLVNNRIEWGSFLPYEMTELEFAEGFISSSIFSLPSLTHFRRLHTIKFVQMSLSNAPILANESLWPESLRTLEYVNAYPIDVALIDPGTIVFPPSLTRLILSLTGDTGPFPDLSALIWPERLSSLNLYVTKAIVNWSPPSQLHDLTCGVSHQQDLASVKWPDHLQSLKITRIQWGWPMKSLSSILLPESLHTLILWIYMDLDQRNEESLKKVVFPASLRKLVLGMSYPHPISPMKLPTELTHLETSVSSLRPFSSSLERFTQLKYLKLNGEKSDPTMSSELHLPSSLETLEFGLEVRNPSLEGIQLPARLRSLLIRSIVFNQSLSSVALPSSLRRLEFGWRGDGDIAHVGRSWFNEPIDLSATQVEILDLGENWNQPLSQLQLPSTLRELHFGGEFSQSFAGFHLPPHLEVLTIGPVGNGSSMFNEVESLMQLQLPRTIRKLVLPFPPPPPAEIELSANVKAAYTAFIANLNAGPIMVHLVHMTQ